MFLSTTPVDNEELSLESAEKKTRSILPTKTFLAFLVITSLALPASNFFGIPVKHIAYILFLFTLLTQWMRGERINKSIITLFVVSCAFVILYILIGALNGYTHISYVFSESLTFFTTLVVAFSILIAKSMCIMKDEELISYAFYGIFIFSLWKSALGILMLFGVLSYNEVSDFCTIYLDYKPVGGWGYSDLRRINFIIFDFISVSFLFFIQCFPKAFIKVPLLLQRLFIVISIICLIFAFSRFLFALAALSWVYTFLFKYSFTKRFFSALLIICALVAMSTWVQEMFETRYASKATEISDEIREGQTDALMRAWERVPFLGGGFGYYAKDYVRSASVPFTYEVQWLSFLAKLGIVGIVFPVFLVLLLFYEILKEERSFDHYVLSLVLLSFIAGGFTNQYILNSASGVFYILHLSIASVLHKKNVPYVSIRKKSD